MYLADIPYTSDRGTHRTLDLHVHADDTSTKPLIVFVHGGAWIASVSLQRRVPILHSSLSAEGTRQSIKNSQHAYPQPPDAQ